MVTLVYIILSSDTFQNWVTGRITGYLSDKFKTTISIGHISYHPFTQFTLDQVYWGDQKSDTLFYVENLKFNLGGFDSDSLKLTLNKVQVNGGYCKIITYKDKTFNIDVLFNILDKNDTIVDPHSKKFKLFFDDVVTTNARFRFIDSTRAFEPLGFDGFNQDFYEAAIHVKNFWIIKDSLVFDVKNISCKERSGVEVKSVSCKADISPSGMNYTNLDLKTRFSHVTKSFHIKYNGWDELSDYNNKANMHAEIVDSKIDMRDIGCFITYFYTNKQVFFVNGLMNGEVKNLHAKHLNVTYGKSSHFSGNVLMKGLPDITETFIDVKADDASTNKDDLDYLLEMKFPKEVSLLGNMKFKGHYTGFYNDFVSFGEFNTALGNISSDINMKIAEHLDNSNYSGNIELTDFNIGGLMGMSKYIGKTTIKTKIQGQGFSLNAHQSNFKSTINYLYANGYKYSNIELDGQLDKKMFEGKLAMNDPNAKVNFAGTVDLNSSMARYKFLATVKDANLKELKFDTSEKVFSSDIDIDLKFKDLDNNNGKISFDNVSFVKDEKEYILKHLEVVSKNELEMKQLKVKSEMLDAELKGKYQFMDLADNVRNILYTVLPNYILPSKRKLKDEDFHFKINLISSDFITNVFYPNIRFYDFNVEGRFSSLQKDVVFNAVAKRIFYNQTSIQNLALKSNISSNQTGRVLIGVDQLYQNDSLLLKDFTLQSDIQKDKIENKLKIKDSTCSIQANVVSRLDFTPNHVILTFAPSDISYRKKLFHVTDSSSINYSDSQVVFNNIKILERESSLAINGFYNFKDLHNIRADINNFDLGVVNVLFAKIPVRFGGVATGSVVYKGNDQKNYLNTALQLSDFSIDKDTLGNFSVTSNYNEGLQRFLVYAKSLNGKLQNFEAGGYISTAADKKINIDVTLNESDVKAFQPFMRDEVSFFNGTVSTKCSITGTIDQPLMNGIVKLMNIDLRVEYLKTRFRFHSLVNFDNHLIKFEQFPVMDENARTGMIGGTITHKGFSDMYFNISATKLDHFKILNTTSKDNSIFYGTAFGSGSVNLSGTADDLLLETNLTTEKGTMVYIPLSTSNESGDGGFINYINKDTAVKDFIITKKNTFSGFELNSIINATPDAEFQLIINEQKGDVIKGKGTGTVKLELNKQGAFNMYGQVIIDQGEYRFTAANLFTKKFTLSKGGNIVWTGDPMQAHMDIQGVYYIRKASITELVPSAATANTLDSKIPVECLLFLNGNLSAPEIKFDINFPDLQNSIGTNNVSEIQNVVRTLRAEPDLMNQQVMSLMLFGKFVPISGYNVSSTNNIQSGAATTLSDMLTAQANTLVGNIIPGLDFNIDYQMANDVSKSRAIVSASKKFYNNRLEVQTSYDPQIANNANIITQYNISKDGNLKMKAFSRNTIDPIYSRNSLSQGVGLYYRKEFDSFIELFNKRKKPIN